MRKKWVQNYLLNLILPFGSPFSKNKNKTETEKNEYDENTVHKERKKDKRMTRGNNHIRWGLPSSPSWAPTMSNVPEFTVENYSDIEYVINYQILLIKKASKEESTDLNRSREMETTAGTQSKHDIQAPKVQKRTIDDILLKIQESIQQILYTLE